MDENKLRASACYYAKHFGWAIFPLKPKEKTPITTNGFKDASKEVATIMQWWGRWPDANIGIATGDVSGFWVLDVDKHHGGFDTLDQLIKDYSPLPMTVESDTGSGGNHILFKMPDWDLRNNAGTKLGQGLDIRGNGGYIVAAPSIHPNGNAYVWNLAFRPGDVPLAPAPGWLLDKLKESRSQEAPTTPVTPDKTPATTPNGYVSKRTLDFIAHGAPVGEQRDRAVRAARNYLSVTQDLNLTIDKIWEGLQHCENEAGKPAWTEKDAAYLVNNLDENTPPPLPEYDGWASSSARYNQSRMEWIICASAYFVPELALVEMGWLKPEHFTYYKTRHFWEVFLSTQDKTQAAQESGTLPQLLSLAAAIEPHLFSEYARNLTQAKYMTDVSHKLHRLNLAVAHADLETTRQLIHEMETTAPVVEGRPLGTVESGIGKLDEILDNPLSVIKTEIPPLDRALRGLPLRFHSVWAARPGLGKTTLLWQIARNVARSKRRVCVFSLEMSEADLWGKAVCGVLGLDWYAVLAGEIDYQDRVNVRRAMERIKGELEGYIFVDDRPNTTDTIWQAVLQYKPDLVIVDHLRLLNDQDDNFIQRLGKMTKRLKEIAKLGNCHVATIHQVNRAVEGRGDKEPNLSDLRDSGLIEEDVDLACMLYRDDYYEKHAKPEPRVWTKLIITKNRFGKGKPPRINMMFDTQHEFYDVMEEIKPFSENGHKVMEPVL